MNDKSVKIVIDSLKTIEAHANELEEDPKEVIAVSKEQFHLAYRVMDRLQEKKAEAKMSVPMLAEIQLSAYLAQCIADAVSRMSADVADSSQLN